MHFIAINLRQKKDLPLGACLWEKEAATHCHFILKEDAKEEEDNKS